MKLTDIETFAFKNPQPAFGGKFWIFVRLHTENGISGIGEIYGVQYSPQLICKMAEDVFTRCYKGQSPFDGELLYRRAYSSGFSQRADLAMGGIVSGLDMACYDIKGKALEQPVYNLLGGKVHERLRAYTYLYPEKVEQAGAKLDYSVYDKREAAAKTAISLTPTFNAFPSPIIFGTSTGNETIPSKYFTDS